MSVDETSANLSTGNTWCANHGAGWEMPTKSDLYQIARNRETINNTLSINSFTLLGTGNYGCSDIAPNGTRVGVLFSDISHTNSNTGSSLLTTAVRNL